MATERKNVDRGLFQINEKVWGDLFEETYGVPLHEATIEQQIEFSKNEILDSPKGIENWSAYNNESYKDFEGMTNDTLATDYGVDSAMLALIDTTFGEDADTIKAVMMAESKGDASSLNINKGESKEGIPKQTVTEFVRPKAQGGGVQGVDYDAITGAKTYEEYKGLMRSSFPGKDSLDKSAWDDWTNQGTTPGGYPPIDDTTPITSAQGLPPKPPVKSQAQIDAEHMGEPWPPPKVQDITQQPSLDLTTTPQGSFPGDIDPKDIDAISRHLADQGLTGDQLQENIGSALSSGMTAENVYNLPQYTQPPAGPPSVMDMPFPGGINPATGEIVGQTPPPHVIQQNQQQQDIVSQFPALQQAFQLDPQGTSRAPGKYGSQLDPTGTPIQPPIDLSQADLSPGVQGMTVTQEQQPPPGPFVVDQRTPQRDVGGGQGVGANLPILQMIGGQAVPPVQGALGGGQPSPYTLGPALSQNPQSTLYQTPTLPIGGAGQPPAPIPTLGQPSPTVAAQQAGIDMTLPTPPDIRRNVGSWLGKPLGAPSTTQPAIDPPPAPITGAPPEPESQLGPFQPPAPETPSYGAGLIGPPPGPPPSSLDIRREDVSPLPRLATPMKADLSGQSAWSKASQGLQGAFNKENLLSLSIMSDFAKALDPEGFGGRLADLNQQRLQGQMYDQYLGQLQAGKSPADIRGMGTDALSPELRQQAIADSQADTPQTKMQREVMKATLSGAGKLGPESTQAYKVFHSTIGKLPGNIFNADGSINAAQLTKQMLEGGQFMTPTEKAALQGALKHLQSKGLDTFGLTEQMFGGTTSVGDQPGAPQMGMIQTVTSQAGADALPPGTVFIQNGKKYKTTGTPGSYEEVI